MLVEVDVVWLGGVDTAPGESVVPVMLVDVSLGGGGGVTTPGESS